MLRILLTLGAFTVLTGDLLATDIGVRQQLTSAKDNVHLDEWEHTWSPDEKTKVRIAKSTMQGGKQEGVDIIEVDNGKLSFTVIPTRGMSVLGVTQGDIRLGWESPVQEVVHPKFIRLEDRGGLGWLEGFNEWMVRCGLEYAGHPGNDPIATDGGTPKPQQLTLHGKIGNIPASEVEVIVDEEPPHRIRVRGQVVERGFYGPQLELWTEISTVPGSSELRIDDIVINRGADEQEFQVIYHANYGRPLLEKGSQVIVAAKRVTPFDNHAASDIDNYATYVGPTKGFQEQVYLIEPFADERGKTIALLKNAAGDKGTAIRWSTEQLPYLTIWKNTAATQTGYVTGIEPGTGYPFNRRIERHFGRVPRLKPGQERRFSLEFTILADADAVSKTEQQVRDIQGDQETEVVSTPPDLKVVKEATR
ncbi:MAG: aldose 1-epimerase family protein [Planctomycetales bacterium]